jgi:hypothetical protein
LGAPIGLLLALLSVTPLAAAEEAPLTVEGAPVNDAGRWPYALPFQADAAIKRGYELPLPRGVSAEAGDVGIRRPARGAQHVVGILVERVHVLGGDVPPRIPP